MQSVQPLDLDKRFKKLFQSGKLVQVHVSKWSMTASATEKDLGLEKNLSDGIEKTTIPGFVTLGKKSLFTDDVRLVFSRIESNARVYLANNSHRFPIADAHFVPQKNLVNVLSDLEALQKKYMKEVDTFITNYENYKEKMFAAYPDYKDNLLPYYPSAEQARAKFGFGISVYEVAFPKKINKVTVNDIIAQNDAAEEVKQKYDAMMRQQYQHHLKQMQDFLTESASGMRNEIVKTFEVIAQKIQNREVVSVSNLKTIRNTIESFDALDFLNDSKIKDNLATLRSLVNSGADFKEDPKAIERLSIAMNTTLTTARSMSDIDNITGEYTRRLDIDDE
jgi:hypothetical protein